MSEYTYTREISATSPSHTSICKGDITLLNGNNIVLSIGEQYTGINPVASFDIAK